MNKTTVGLLVVIALLVGLGAGHLITERRAPVHQRAADQGMSVTPQVHPPVPETRGESPGDGDSAQTVYVTRTGKRYHVAGCGSLSRSSIPISLGDAKAQGYVPCERCRPPE